jgi:hypothetical protein
LKLQRNVDNYHYLKNTRSGGGVEMTNSDPGSFTAADKEDFQITKVSFFHFLVALLLARWPLYGQAEARNILTRNLVVTK